MPFSKPKVLQPAKTSTTKPKIALCKKRKLNASTHEIQKKPKPTEEPHKKFAFYAQNTFRRMKVWNPPLKTNLLVKPFDQEKASEAKKDDESIFAQGDQAFSKNLEPENYREKENVISCSISPKNQLQSEVNNSEIPNINEHLIENPEVDITCSSIGDIQQSESKDRQETFICVEKEPESSMTPSEREKSNEITVESQEKKIINQMLDLVSIYNQEEPSRDGNSVRSVIISEFPEQIDNKIETVGKADGVSKIPGAENLKKTVVNFSDISPTTESGFNNEHLETFQNDKPSCPDFKNGEFSQNNVESGLTLGNKALNTETKDGGIQSICDPKGDEWLDEKTQIVGNKSSEELSSSSNDDLDDIVEKAIDKYMNKEKLAQQLEEMLAQGKIESSQETVIVSPQKRKPGKLSSNKQRLKASLKKQGKQNENKRFASKCFPQDNNFGTNGCNQPRKEEIQDLIDITKDSETMCDNILPLNEKISMKFNSNETMIFDPPAEDNSTNPRQNLNYVSQISDSRLIGEKLESENTSQNINVENKDFAHLNLYEIPTKKFSNKRDEMVENSMHSSITRDTTTDKHQYLKAIDDFAGMSLKLGDEKLQEGMEVVERNLQTDDYISKFQEDNEDDLFLQVEENQVEPFDTQKKHEDAKLGEVSNLGSPLSIFEESFCSPDEEENLFNQKSPRLVVENGQVWDQAGNKKFEEQSIISRSLKNNMKADGAVSPITDMKHNRNSVLLRNPTGVVPVSPANIQNFGTSIRTCSQYKQIGRASHATFQTFNDLYSNKCLIDSSFNSISNKNGEHSVYDSILKKETPARKFNQQLQPRENYFHNTSYAGVLKAQTLPAELNPFHPEQGNSKKMDITTQPNKQKFKEKLQFLKGLMDQNKLRREKKIDEIRELVFDTNIFVYDLIDSLKPRKNEE